MKKKIFFLLALVIVIPASSQQSFKTNEQKSSLILSAGISIPVVCYASKNISNEEAGFAKIGFNINLVYEFRFVKNAGVAGKIFYSFNEVDKKISAESPGTAINNYKYYGLMIGPYFTHRITDNTDLSIKFLPGILRVNSPTLAQNGNAVTTTGGATDFAWSAGADFRYNLKGKNSFILMNGDFTSSKPDFKVPALSEGRKIEQHIAVVNVNAGFGLKF